MQAITNHKVEDTSSKSRQSPAIDFFAALIDLPRDNSVFREQNALIDVRSNDPRVRKIARQALKEAPG
jgi:hypothetical protein